MSEEKKILFIGGGFTKQISKIVNDEEKDTFVIPTIEQFISYNKGLLDVQARELYDFISRDRKLENVGSWEIDVVKQIKDEIKDPEKKQKLLNYAQWIYSDTLGLNYGISPTCPDKRRGAVGKIIEMIEHFMDEYKFQVIMTTNHDLTIDHWLLAGWDNYQDLLEENPRLFGFDFPCNNHWIKTPDRFSEDYFSYKAYDKEKIKKVGNDFRFLKLHGALNWWKNYWGSKDSIPLLNERLPQWAVGKSIREYYVGVQEYLMGSNKEKDYKREPYKTILDEARDQLSKVEEIVFYGFGFGEADNDLAKELFSGDRFNQKKLCVTDINRFREEKDKKDKKFEIHKTRVKDWCYNSGFKGFFDFKFGYSQDKSLNYELIK